MSEKKIAILYHGGCPDGFGGAYAAWKKFGDAAEYIPVKHDKPVPMGLEGKEVYLIDFCYKKDLMDALQKASSRFMVLDHHAGIRDVVESMPNHIFDDSRSGTSIAWNYFHPDVPLPTFLKYIEDGDLNRKVSDDERSILTYGYAQPTHFDTWSELIAQVEDPTGRAAIMERGKVYAEYFALLSRQLADGAELVEFEGYTCYLAAAERMFIHDVAMQLVRKHPPFALIARVETDGIRVSFRADGSVDVAKLAQKYGGNGHPSAAAFLIPWGTPIPWKAHKPTA